MEAILKDRLFFKDRPEQLKIPELPSHGLWTKTEVMGSNDDMVFDEHGFFSHFVKKIPTGISALGETIFRTEKTKPKWTESNMVPIGGCQFAMEKLFGVKATQFAIPTLAENNIGITDSSTPTETYDVPGGTKTIIYRAGNFVQLFGIGITGTAENDTTIHTVDYRENSIDVNRVTTDGLTLTGTMIPFRYTTDSLTSSEKLQYFGQRVDGATGEIGYYIKRFDSDPIIKHIWKTGEETDSETLVSSSDIWSNTSGVNSVSSFTEFVLQISKDDVREWFIANGQEDRARINTIALFTGEYVKRSDGNIGDYRDVRLFSKLNIPVENLSLSKDLNLVYRVYTA